LPGPSTHVAGTVWLTIISLCDDGYLRVEPAIRRHKHSGPQVALLALEDFGYRFAGALRTFAPVGFERCRGSLRGGQDWCVAHCGFSGSVGNWMPNAPGCAVSIASMICTMPCANWRSCAMYGATICMVLA